jgi:hypothetical protein
MAAPGEMQLQKTAEDSLTLVLTGSWKLGQELPSTDVVQQRVGGCAVTTNATWRFVHWKHGAGQ